MCLAVPAKILEINGQEAKVDILGIVKNISLLMIEDVQKGDFVLVHVGFALQKLSEKEAQKTIEIFKESV
ncbi:HypC/HybG/HupF family hydrogenase formation chaperone [bacterium]|nr:HypC/HybG/HupF family hydrogenase formation chaperone [bacterium]